MLEARANRSTSTLMVQAVWSSETSINSTGLPASRLTGYTAVTAFTKEGSFIQQSNYQFFEEGTGSWPELGELGKEKPQFDVFLTVHHSIDFFKLPT